jgi:hypothetical protein
MRNTPCEFGDDLVAPIWRDQADLRLEYGGTGALAGSPLDEKALIE